MVLTISNQDVSYQVSEDAMQQAVRFFNQPMPAISGGKLLMTMSFEAALLAIRLFLFDNNKKC